MRALLLSLALLSAPAIAQETSATRPGSPPPVTRNIIADGCTAGHALVGMTVERYRGQSVSLRPRCRPAPTGNTNAWCDPSPPAGVNCQCDGYEQLQWQLLVTGSTPGCWACVGTGQACPQPPSCNCINDAGQGAWVPMQCIQTAAAGNPNQLRNNFDATQEHCVRLQTTGCTYRSVPGKTC